MWLWCPIQFLRLWVSHPICYLTDVNTNPYRMISTHPRPANRLSVFWTLSYRTFKENVGVGLLLPSSQKSFRVPAFHLCSWSPYPEYSRKAPICLFRIHASNNFGVKLALGKLLYFSKTQNIKPPPPQCFPKLPVVAVTSLVSSIFPSLLFHITSDYSIL